MLNYEGFLVIVSNHLLEARQISERSGMNET